MATTHPESGLALYHSPLGLLDFQAEGVAEFVLGKNKVAVWSCGLGKTHLGMASAALLFEDDMIDLCVVACEANKVDEWVKDFETFTDLATMKYRGTLKRREKLRNEISAYQVMVSTYETIREDTAMLDGGRSKRAALIPKFLPELLKGKRVMFIYDEATKLKGRSSTTHRAHRLLVDDVRAFGDAWTLGLTATPIERDPSDFYNLCRIIDHDLVGSVSDFEAKYTKGKDFFNKYIGFKNISVANTTTVSFAQKVAPVIMRKRKSDPDVREQFPDQTEEFVFVELNEAHQDFYEEVAKLDIADEGVMFGLLRQVAGHPLAISNSQGELAKMIAEEVGVAGLRKLGAAKLDQLIRDLDNMVNNENSQVIVWTYFGQSLLPHIHAAIRDEFKVSLNYGGMDTKARAASKEAFVRGDTAVFLSSDAGARGINLPNASYSVQYDMPVTFAIYQQRMDRNHRIDSMQDSVTNISYIAKNTVEEGIDRLVIKRNRWSEDVFDAELSEGHGEATHLDADLRKKLISISRKTPIKGD